MKTFSAIIGIFAVATGLLMWQRASQPDYIAEQPATIEPEVSLTEKVGQMLMVGIRGSEVDDELRDQLNALKPGGVVLFDNDIPSGGEVARNIVSPEQLASFTNNLRAISDTPLLIAVDAEGGYVNRLKDDYGFEVVVPTAQTLGTGAVADTRNIAGLLAKQLRDVGINMNLAPVVDVNLNPDGPAIGYLERSFSADPSVVTEHAGAFIDAHDEIGIITTLKHFPGHGSASEDTHLGVTDVTGSYDSKSELAPYRSFIESGYDGPIMTAHIVNQNLDTVPATLSRNIITNLLRGELGFEGVVVSDDMQMGAIVEEYGLTDAVLRAIDAGVDIIMLANQIGDYDFNETLVIRDAILGAVQSGALSEDRIDESYERIMQLKEQSGL